MNIYYILFIVGLVIGVSSSSVMAQNSMAPLEEAPSTTPTDTTGQLETFDRNSDISPTAAVMDDDVTYGASDSVIMLADGTVVMYNNARVVYGEIELEAYYIRLNRDSNMIYAEGRRDSLGQLEQTPKFTDGGQTFESQRIRYNFNTGKGLIYNVASEQADGYVTGGVTKRVDEESLCMRNGRYTTCANKEHPHFYLAMTKAKVRPGKSIATGPAYLVMEGVKLPLFIPFGYFPFTQKYSSGFLMPSYGEEQQRGFFLKNGGYYFAMSDYMDLSLTGDIYTNGSWATYAKTNYSKRYKFNGNFNATYRVTANGDEALGTQTKSKDFSVRWTHRQDAKASPYSSFSASVNFSSSTYETNDRDRIYDASGRSSRNRKSSSISYSKRFPEAPFNISLSANTSQNAADSSISVSLPQLAVSMNRIYPFKRKVKVGKTRYYEKFGISYTGSLANSFQGKQDELFSSDLVKEWRNGVKHSIPIQIPSFQIFKRINVSPSINYTERWYSSSIRQTWDSAHTDEGRLIGLQRDTTWGFNRVYDYSGGVSMSTKMYGMYYPFRKLFGDKVQVIRHVMTPSVSMSWRPDFGQEKFGYYDTYQQYNANDSTWNEVQYSLYQGSLYGTPGTGKSGVVSFSLGNNIEMKVRDDRDSTAEFKKVKIIDRLNLGSSYNLMADSLNLSDIRASLSFTLFKKSINISANFDPYSYDNTGRKINTFYVQDKGKLMRLTRASTSMGMSINEKKINDFISKRFGGSEEEEGEDKKSPEKFDEDGYLAFSIPWSMNFSYSYSINSVWDKELEDYIYEGNSNLNASANISLTDKWKLSCSSGYNFRLNKMASTRFSVTRDLHCWSMSASFVPIGTYKSYNFSIHVNSSMLQDLKYDKRSSPYDRSWE